MNFDAEGCGQCEAEFLVMVLNVQGSARPRPLEADASFEQ